MSAKRHEIQASEVQGVKYFKALSGLLERRHEVGCARDRAGNRLLHRDQYVCLLLLYLFNPICTSLRSLPQASELKKVQKKLGAPWASLGSLSEAATVFDSQQMLTILRELGQQLQPLATPDKLGDLPGILTVVEVKYTPHVKRLHTGRGGPEQSETLAIATNLVDLPADVIALIFRYRWTIEIFFRFYQHILGCRHLLSYHRNGIELQTYAAILACMLISLWTGRKSTLRTFEMLCWYFTGRTRFEELQAHLARLHKTQWPSPARSLSGLQSRSVLRPFRSRARLAPYSGYHAVALLCHHPEQAACRTGL